MFTDQSDHTDIEDVQSDIFTDQSDHTDKLALVKKGTKNIVETNNIDTFLFILFINI